MNNGEFFNTSGSEIERSLRFNSADSAHLSRTPSVAGNRKTWTWAGWVKLGALGTVRQIFTSRATSFPYALFYIFSDDKISFADNSLNTHTTAAVYRDPSAWYHIQLAVDTTTATAANRVRLWVNGVLQTWASTTAPTQNADGQINTATAHSIGSLQPWSGSEYFSGYLADVHFIDGQALDPTSFGEFDTNGVWQPKVYEGTYGTNGFRLPFSDNSTAAALGTDTSGNGNTWTVNNLSVGSQPTTNYSDSATLSGTYSPTGVRRVFDGNLTTAPLNTFHSLPSNAFITVALGTPFTSVTSVRVYGYNGDPTGTYSLGYRINSETYLTPINANNSSTAWQDLSSQLSATGNTVSSVSVQWSGNNTPDPRNVGPYAIEINGTVLVDVGIDIGNDSFVDSPTNYGGDTGAGGEVRGNYCTLNPLSKGGTHALSNGNLDFSMSGSSGSTSTFGTIGVSSGKWYWEMLVTSVTALYYPGIGVETNPNPAVQSGSNTTGFTYLNTGEKLFNSSLSAYGASFTTNDIISVALDMDAGTLVFYKNGASQGQLASGITGTAFPVIIGQLPCSGSLNFGQRPFAYTAPSGFKALCTANLPEPTIADGSTAMDVVTYTGNGGFQSITGLNFSPDFVWVKERSQAINDHVLKSSLQTKFLSSDEAYAERGNDGDLISSFDTTGFTVSTTYGGGVGNSSTNGPAVSYVAWTWDAGSSTVTNTDGSITSQVRANASAGFSVVTYTGTGSAATVGHGLGVAPSLIITKRRDSTSNWLVQHRAAGLGYLILNSTAAYTGFDDTAFNGTFPTSSVFSIGSGIGGNQVAYCFAPVAGYSAFGSYIGNGLADGPFVYTGFRPRWVMIKASSFVTYGNWVLHDTSRSISNVSDKNLYANASDSEDGIYLVDCLSNGFKLRSASFDGTNGSGAAYIYAAFAEHPFATSRAR